MKPEDLEKNSTEHEETSRRLFLKTIGLAVSAAVLGEASVFVQDAFTSSPLEEKIEKEYGFGVIGNTSKQNVQQLYKTLKLCEKYWETFRKEARHIWFIDLKSSFWSYLHEFIGAAGGASFGTIMLDSIEDETLIHETAHIYHNALGTDRGVAFSKKWWQLADMPYGSLVKKSSFITTEWKDNSVSLGKEGFMSPYGSTSLREDVATYQETLYVITRLIKQLNKDNKFVDYNNIYSLFFQSDPKKDSRYRKKISLLKEYGFIGPNDFKLIQPIFW